MKLIILGNEIEFDNPEQLLNMFFFLTKEGQKSCIAKGLTVEDLDYEGIIKFDKEYRLGM